MQSTEVSGLIETGLRALQLGELTRAREALEGAVARGVHTAEIFHALARIHTMSGDMPTAHEHLKRALQIEPQYLPSLFATAELYSASGDSRAALSFYSVVAAIGDETPALEPNLAEIVATSRRKAAEYSSRMSTYLLSHVAAGGYNRNRSSGRFTHALDLLLGKRQVYLQQPRAFYVPELPNIQFFPNAMFPWLSVLEAATDDICEELKGLLANPSEFEPYLSAEKDRPPGDPMGLAGKMDWSAFFLWKDGRPVDENVRRFPRTMAAFDKVPLTSIPGRAPSILFSRLLPGAHIPPHHGFLNSRLIGHLPLIAPPGCHFRVGNETRQWERGKAWLFDDSIEHEAVNSSDRERIVLIFEVWRPELSEEERALVARLIQGVDTYNAEATSQWTA